MSAEQTDPVQLLTWIDWLSGISFFYFFESEDFSVSWLVFNFEKLWITFGFEDFFSCRSWFLSWDGDVLIFFPQLDYTCAKDPESGINLSKGEIISLTGSQLVFITAQCNMKSVSVWICAHVLLLLLGEKWNMELTCNSVLSLWILKIARLNTIFAVEHPLSCSLFWDRGCLGHKLVPPFLLYAVKWWAVPGLMGLIERPMAGFWATYILHLFNNHSCHNRSKRSLF